MAVVRRLTSFEQVGSLPVLHSRSQSSLQFCSSGYVTVVVHYVVLVSYMVCWRCGVLALRCADIVVWWQCGVLALRCADIVVCWHCGGLALRCADIVVCWHCGVLALRCADIAVCWHCGVLTLRARKWCLYLIRLDSPMRRSHVQQGGYFRVGVAGFLRVHFLR
jgi:hypothetical protein